MNKFLILAVALVVFAAGLAALFLTPKSGTGGPNPVQTAAGHLANQAALPSCGGNTTLLYAPPVDLAEVTNMVPLGNPNPPAHTLPTDHMYFIFRKQYNFTQDSSQNPPAVKLDLKSPGRATINQITSSEYTNVDPPRSDYSITLSPCKEVSIKFGHVTGLSDNVL